jgi:hypothetical protein
MGNAAIADAATGSLRETLDADRRDLLERDRAGALAESSAMLLPFVLALARLTASRDVIGSQ